MDLLDICLFDVDELAMDEHRDQLTKEFIDGVHSFLGVANADKPKNLYVVHAKNAKTRSNILHQENS